MILYSSDNIKILICDRVADGSGLLIRQEKSSTWVRIPTGQQN